jgi:hypothetical protein
MQINPVISLRNQGGLSTSGWFPILPLRELLLQDKVKGLGGRVMLSRTVIDGSVSSSRLFGSRSKCIGRDLKTACLMSKARTFL